MIISKEFRPQKGEHTLQIKSYSQLYEFYYINFGVPNRARV
jgi:hypothetical protein